MTLAAKLFVLPLLALALGFVPALAVTDVPNMTFIGQEQGNWCWAASDQMIRVHYGTSTVDKQCEVANVAASNCQVTPDCCQGGSCNQQCSDQIRTYYPGTFDVSHFDIKWSTIQNEVDGKRPFIIDWGWQSGGGHIMVGIGYSSTTDKTVRVYDPMQGLIGIPFYNLFLQGTNKVRTNIQ